MAIVHRFCTNFSRILCMVALFFCVITLPTISFGAYDYTCGTNGFPMRFAGCKPGYYYEDWENANDSISPDEVGECIECPTGYKCAGGFAGPIERIKNGSTYDCNTNGFPMRFAGCKPGYYYEDWENADDSITPDEVGECIKCPTGYECAGGFAGPVEQYIGDTWAVMYNCNVGHFPMRFGGCKPGYYYEDWENANYSLHPDEVGECIECPSCHTCAGGFAGPVNQCGYTITYKDGDTVLNDLTDQYTTEDYGKDLATYSKEYFVFNGWCVDEKTCDNPIKTIPNEWSGDKTLYAQWKRTITVHFDANAGNDETEDIPEDKVCVEGEDCYVTLEIVKHLNSRYDTTPERTGYKFTNYNTDQNGTGISFEYEYLRPVPGGAIYVTYLSNVFNLTDGHEITLYAQWTPIEYSITYMDGTDTMPGLMPYKYTIETETFVLPEPVKAHFKFVNWFDNAELTGEPVTQITLGSYGNKKLYAQWKRTITIHFDANAGDDETENIPEDEVFVEGEDCIIRKRQPTRQGYVFSNYTPNQNGTGKTFQYIRLLSCYPICMGVDLSDVFNLTDGHEITLYAQWEFVCESGKWYHIGNDDKNKICLYEHKKTSPAMAIELKDANTYYMMLSPDSELKINNESDIKMHLLIGNDIYNAHDESVNQ